MIGQRMLRIDMKLFFAVIVALLLFCSVTCFLPGIPTRDYKAGNLVRVKTRKLTSIHDLPFDYYSLNYCRPKPIKPFAENLGEYFFGDRIENSVYNVSLLNMSNINSLY